MASRYGIGSGGSGCGVRRGMTLIEHIEIVPYDVAWTEVFEIQAKEIKKVLGDNCIAMHHIGSTSVSGLSAKPIIDLMPVVLDILVVDQANQGMEALGYEAKGECGMLFRRYFQKEACGIGYHVHVFEQGNAEIDRHLKFRNWMRTHEKDRDAYVQLKRSLVERFSNDIMGYCLGKSEFIADIDAKTGWEGFRVVVALTPAEWDAYQRIQKTRILPISHHDFDGLSRSMVQTDNQFHFVLYHGASIVCAAHVEFTNRKEALLRSLGVDSACQRDGIAEQMMEFLKRWVKHQGRQLKSSS